MKFWLSLFAVFLLSILSPLAKAEAAASLSALFLKKFTEAQTALAQQQRATSRTILMGLAEQHDNSPYENGLVWSMLGFLHFQNGDLRESASAYEKALRFDIPASLAQDNRRALGQIYQSLGDCRNAVTQYERWLSRAPDDNDKEDIQVWAAQCHYQLAHYKNAVQHLQAAIASVNARQQTPKETWLALLQASQSQLDDAKDRIATLKMLLRWYPKTDYWLALAGAFGQLDRLDDYLATLAVAERRQLLDSETQYLSLASVYYEAGIPYSAARILEQGMRAKRIKTNEKNLRFLASCYSLAQEFEKALPPLQQAAGLTRDGEADALLGNALFQLARWPEAASALETALQKGGGKQRETLWLMLGQAYLNQHRFDQAIEAFSQVLPVESHNHQGLQWINYARYERKRQTELGLLKEAKP